MPVTKTQDAPGQAADVAVEPSQADVSRAMSGDSAAALKFMKGVQVTDQVPATIGNNLRTVRR
jgi:hypothetical protein